MLNVTFLDAVPKDEIAPYWSLLDVSIIHLSKTELFSSVMPSKLLECMRMGTPVLLGIRGESAGIVRRCGIGLAFEPKNVTELFEGIKMMANYESLREAFRVRGPVEACGFDRALLAYGLFDTTRQVTFVRK